MGACPACGTENAATAKFCSECGAALAGAPAVARREERKVVSVVFTDLVGSTARAEESDPEDVRALLRVYHERTRDELERLGGTVEKFIGDAVVAVFGAPVAHEDDPERAVRAALAVRDAVARLNEEQPGRDLHVRIAVNSGEALVSLDASPGEGEGMVAGDVMNTAARLQSAAPVDGILVGEQTHRATEREIVYREVAPVQAKGKAQPVPVWEAIEPRARLGVDLGGAAGAALVGRDGELDVLVDALGRSRRDRSTQLVTLVGVPGIGKSRLVVELGRVVDADEELVTWRQGRCLPYGDGVSYWALGEIVKAHAGILESDAADETESKLGSVLEAIADEGERAWVERHLRPLVGLGRVDARGDERGEAFAAWRRFIESVAEGGPMVLVFEDLHWADDGLLDFVDGLVDWVDGVPLLVVCTSRPELLERRPGWGGGKRNATTISLAALDDDATARLVLALLERPVLEADTQRALVERAAGNPLYAEEFVRMLQAGAAVDERLPESVQGIIAARIDLLPATEKDLLQTAAVHGKVFWSDALASAADIEPWRLTELLRSLERKEFVRREHRSAVAGASQHAFVHALVRDAAYNQLPRAARAARHLAAAEWIESLPDDRAEDRAETLAHHYMTAIELRRAAGEDVAALGPRAVRALQDAGERALALGAYEAAVSFLENALELLPDDSEPSAELLFHAGRSFAHAGRSDDHLERAIDAFERAGDPERAAEAAVAASWHAWHTRPADARGLLDRAAAIVDGRPPSRATALVLAEQARMLMMNFQFESGRREAERAIEHARAIGDVELEADATVTQASCMTKNGDSSGMELFDRALELVGHGRVAARAYTNLGVAWASLGDLRRAVEISAEGAARAERDGDVQGAAFLRGNLLGIRFDSGEWDEALGEANSLIGAPGFNRQEYLARTVRAIILDSRGEPAAAEVDFELALASARESAEAAAVLPALVGLAGFRRRHGRTGDAAAALDEVVAGLDASESVGDIQEFHVELVVELLDARRPREAENIVGRMPAGPWRDACQALIDGDDARAADTLASIGTERLAAELRLRSARALTSAGRLGEAEAQLELARVFFRKVGATAFLAEADAILAAAS
ncbi:MAG TPA: adenylate/guanylate cyclase domain-containing protein [Gaiella sp.]|nr:adenylate/guanylate cyclase domain-containing protein [Gaiella sp.]